MKSSQLNRVVDLVRRTGDRCVIFDSETDSAFALMSLDEYENLLDPIAPDFDFDPSLRRTGHDFPFDDKLNSDAGSDDFETGDDDEDNENNDDEDNDNDEDEEVFNAQDFLKKMEINEPGRNGEADDFKAEDLEETDQEEKIADLGKKEEEEEEKFYLEPLE